MEISGLLGLLLWLVIVGLVFYLLWWLVGFIGLPEPFDKVMRVVIAIVAVVILINMLLPSLGHAPVFKLR